MHERCSGLESHTSKASSESIQVLSWVILVVSIFNMHARRPIRPHMTIKPKIEVSAGGKAFTRLSL
jgi:3-dehydroquinate dehydratase